MNEDRKLNNGQPRPDVCVTMSAYALGKKLGPRAAMEEIQRQLDKPGRDSLPGVRTIARLRQYFDLALRIDTGGTVIGKVRSRHAHEAWESGAGVWFAVDDDNEATQDTLLAMIEAVTDPATPSIVLAPYWVRGASELAPRLSVDMPRIISGVRELASGIRLRTCTGGGFGLVAMNRAALGAVRDARAHLLYEDDDGIERLALFRDEVVVTPEGQRRWLGEDLSFFWNVPDAVRVEALLMGHTVHDGMPFNLRELDQ